MAFLVQVETLLVNQKSHEDVLSSHPILTTSRFGLFHLFLLEIWSSRKKAYIPICLSDGMRGCVLILHFWHIVEKLVNPKSHANMLGTYPILTTSRYGLFYSLFLVVWSTRKKAYIPICLSDCGEALLILHFWHSIEMLVNQKSHVDVLCTHPILTTSRYRLFHVFITVRKSSINKAYSPICLSDQERGCVNTEFLAQC